MCMHLLSVVSQPGHTPLLVVGGLVTYIYIGYSIKISG